MGHLEIEAGGVLDGFTRPHATLRNPAAGRSEAEVGQLFALIEEELARRCALTSERLMTNRAENRDECAADEWLLFDCDRPGCKAVLAADKDHFGDGLPREMEALGWISTQDGRDLCPTHRSDCAS